jgi:ankyrin repeat protein
MYASRNGHTATMELLLGAGADKEAKSEVRETKRAIHTRTCG